MKTMTISESKIRLMPYHIHAERKNDSGSQSGKHKHSLPIIHLDWKGRILYANKAAFPLLREWNCLANDYLPDELVNKHPNLLDPDADFDLRLETKYSSFHLDVIGFRESGYIGLYGFTSVYRNEENAPAMVHSDIV